MLTPKIQASFYGRLLKQQTEALAISALGVPCPDFTATDESGNKVSMASQKGGIMVLDFWASWCGPCRGEIPHLRHVHDIYGKGKDTFNMISVSIDNKESDWKKALEEESMKWTQLCDLKGWQGEVINKYKIQGVPFCLILDKEGRIIDHGVRGSELDVVLIKYLGLSLIHI